MDNRFIDYCIQNGILTRDSIVRAQQMMNESTSFYEALVHSNAITQEDLAISAGEFYDAQVVDLSQVTPEPNALRYGSPVLCRKLSFFPFAVDTLAGVLIAVADYTKTDQIRDFLQGQRVERMNFYVAPCDTLARFIDKFFEAPKPRERLLSFVDGPRQRNNSIMHGQYSSSYESALPVVDSQATEMNTQQIAVNTRQIASLQKKVEAMNDENVYLRQQIDKLNRMLELEAQLSRQLATMLKTNGTLPAAQFDNLLNSIR